MLGEIGEQYGDVEADVLGRTVEPVSELVEVHLAVLVGVDAHHHVVDLLAGHSQQHIVAILALRSSPQSAASSSHFTTPTPTPTSSPTSSRGSSRECRRVVQLATGITSGNRPCGRVGEDPREDICVGVGVVEFQLQRVFESGGITRLLCTLSVFVVHSIHSFVVISHHVA